MIDQNTDNYRHARELAVKYIGISNKTCGKVRSHLEKKGIPESVINKVLEDLSDAGYINDQGVARSIIASRKGKNSEGRLRLRSRLLSSGIPEHVVDSQMEAVPSDSETILSLLRDHFHSEGPIELLSEDYRVVFKKTANLLKSRGYSYDLILHTLNRFFTEVFDSDSDERNAL